MIDIHDLGSSCVILSSPPDDGDVRKHTGSFDVRADPPVVPVEVEHPGGDDNQAADEGTFPSNECEAAASQNDSPQPRADDQQPGPSHTHPHWYVQRKITFALLDFPLYVTVTVNITN